MSSPIGGKRRAKNSINIQNSKFTCFLQFAPKECLFPIGTHYCTFCIHDISSYLLFFYRFILLKIIPMTMCSSCHIYIFLFFRSIYIKQRFSAEKPLFYKVKIYFYFFKSNAVLIRPLNKGWAFVGRDLNSGWNWQPTNQG